LENVSWAGTETKSKNEKGEKEGGVSTSEGARHEETKTNERTFFAVEIDTAEKNSP